MHRQLQRWFAVAAVSLFSVSPAHGQIVDSTFNPGANSRVSAIAVQADGKILVGGTFSMLGGGGSGTTPRSLIGRLNRDGSLDTTFNPGANNLVLALAVQPDGKILVGGVFTVLAGVARAQIGRLNSDGTIDPTFDPGANAPVRGFALQPDGKILVAGDFTKMGGGGLGRYAQAGLARLNPDGTLDANFQQQTTILTNDAVGVQPDGKIVTGFTRLFPSGAIDKSTSSDGSAVYSLAIQADGKVLIGSTFSITRLNPDFSVDTSFKLVSVPGWSMIVQPDGKILVGGPFTLAGARPRGTATGPTYTRRGLVRLLPDGTIDPAFDPGANDKVWAIAREADGSVLVGGDFTGVGGATGTTPRSKVARLLPDKDVVDLNGDHAGDVFRYNPTSGRWVQEVTAGGGFAVGGSNFWSPNWTVMPAHFNDDGFTDFFLFNTSSGQWFRMLGTGAGDFTAQSSGLWSTTWQRHVVDLNGDGLSDVFLWNPSSGEWFEALSNTAGDFDMTHGFWTPGWEIYPASFNTDARQDLFLFNRSTGQWFWAVGEAGGTFSYPQSGFWSTDWQIRLGDFSGNGLTSVLLLRPGTGMWFVGTTTAGGFTYTSGFFSTGYVPYLMDRDGDRRTDLFMHNPTTGQWVALSSNGAGGFVTGMSGVWSVGWNLYPTDFNADGLADLLLYNPTTGIWYQVRTQSDGSVTYASGAWTPGYTIVAGFLGGL